MTSKPLVRRTLATLRRAELGFLGVVVYTRVHTPRRCGQFSSAGLLLLARLATRGLRTSWLIVGMTFDVLLSSRGQAVYGAAASRGWFRPGRLTQNRPKWLADNRPPKERSLLKRFERG